MKFLKKHKFVIAVVILALAALGTEIRVKLEVD